MSLRIPTALYVNRELSWLQFNERVLEEAEDGQLPLFERMRFISIFGSNLDEFFMIRVGGLYDALEFTPDACDRKTGMTIPEQIDTIYDRVRQLLPQVETCYRSLRAELDSVGIHQVDFDHLSEYELFILKRYFETDILPYLAPQIIDRHHPFPYLGNKELFIGLNLEKSPEKKGIAFAVIPVSSQRFPRYHIFPNERGGGYSYVLIAPLIMYFADAIFKRRKIKEKFVFRITRNGDLHVEEALYDEDMDWRSQMEKIIHHRKRSQAVRLQLSQEISPKLRHYLLKEIEAPERSVMVNENLPLSLNHIFDLFGQLSAYYPQLNNPPLAPLMPAGLRPRDSVMDYIIEKGDLFLAYPYHGMKPFIDLLEEAAVSPKVRAIKITLYRLASDSQVAQALIKAAENGKDVMVMIELKARFDEEHNIKWSKRLEEAGCTVIYGMENYKVHSKLCLITMREGNRVSYMTQIGTGNYNEKTSKIYTDFSLMTSNKAIGEEASKVFQNLQLGGFVERSHYLLVAPLQLKNRLIALIDREINIAKHGGQGRIIIKVNGLSNREMLDKLFEASQAGVKITLYVRGICCLRAGIPGYSENITVKSMVGRFLEHPRIYLFGEGDREEIYIGSADWMTRNLLYRVEVAVRILDPKVRQMILDILDILESDNVLARVMRQDGTYRRLTPALTERMINSQDEQYEYFKGLWDDWAAVMNDSTHSADAPKDHTMRLWQQVRAFFKK